MRWLEKFEKKFEKVKEKPRDIWEEPLAGPLGDIEAADRIRAICRTAADSADVVNGRASSAPGKKIPGRTTEEDSARYQRAAKSAMEIAMKVSDELMRDAAVREIVDLCLRANDLKTARILFRAIQSPSIRNTALAEHPQLRT